MISATKIEGIEHHQWLPTIVARSPKKLGIQALRLDLRKLNRRGKYYPRHDPTQFIITFRFLEYLQQIKKNIDHRKVPEQPLKKKWRTKWQKDAA